MLSILLLYLILVPEFLGDSPSIQEILWNFTRYEDKKECLTLKENPHFYTELPTLLKAHGESVKIDSTEDFRYADIFYVLTDKQDAVHIMSGNLAATRSCILLATCGAPKILLFLKVRVSFLEFPSVSDVLTDICGRLIGECIVETSLKGTLSGFYATRVARLPMSTSGVPFPRASRTRNNRGLHPISTKLYPWTDWECILDSPPMNSSVDFCSVCVFTSPVTPVRSKVIKYLTMSANIDLAPGPFAANI